LQSNHVIDQTTAIKTRIWGIAAKAIDRPNQPHSMQSNALGVALAQVLTGQTATQIGLQGLHGLGGLEG
jgi:hypothetical protein